MTKVRVLVANRPRFMREVVLAAIADQPDIEVVGESGDDGMISEYVERTRPDFLIVALESPEVQPAQYGFLLGRYPQMKILAVAPEHNTGILYWVFLDIRSRKFESSERAILATLRSASGPTSYHERVPAG